MAYRYLSVLLLAFCSFTLALVVSGCGLDISEGSQFSGQECFESNDCATGLICSQRRCRPVIAGFDIPDSGGLDDGGGTFDTGLPDTDIAPECAENARRCISDESAEVCINGTWTTRNCNSTVGEICEEGFCMFDDVICTGGETRCLNDETAAFCTGNSWDIIEICGPGETCSDASCVEEADQCCAGGCADGAICSDCSCTEYDIEQCQFQDQPCNLEGQITNNFLCSRLGDQTQLRCFGICNINSPDPSATCPGDSESVCLSNEEDQANGLCLATCDEGDSCADDRMGCLYYDVGPSDGVCMPVSGTGGLGDPCDPEDTFSCTGSNICVEGTCAQSCRPFAGGATDCASGYCLAFDPYLGMCTPSSEVGNGQCNREFTACNGDATGCFNSPFGNSRQCFEFCRLQLGAQDNPDCVDADSSCIEYEEGEEAQDLLGICSSAP